MLPGHQFWKTCRPISPPSLSDDGRELQLLIQFLPLPPLPQHFNAHPRRLTIVQGIPQIVWRVRMMPLGKLSVWPSKNRSRPRLLAVIALAAKLKHPTSVTTILLPLLGLIVAPIPRAVIVRPMPFVRQLVRPPRMVNLSPRRSQPMMPGVR